MNPAEWDWLWCLLIRYRDQHHQYIPGSGLSSIVKIFWDTPNPNGHQPIGDWNRVSKSAWVLDICKSASIWNICKSASIQNILKSASLPWFKIFTSLLWSEIFASLQTCLVLRYLQMCKSVSIQDICKSTSLPWSEIFSSLPWSKVFANLLWPEIFANPSQHVPQLSADLDNLPNSIEIYKSALVQDIWTQYWKDHITKSKWNDN